MAASTFETSIEGIRSAWEPLSTRLLATCCAQLEALVGAAATEEWLAALHMDAPASRELYRDPAQGFVLLAHTEPAGLYRPPHDHGRAWVIYAVQQGIAVPLYRARPQEGGRGSAPDHPVCRAGR